ncbi:hypothetical protein [Lysinibacillus sp. BPa_S21]|uniref:hypothetical protein n=1 Tax=Lysinibacillus sp. BPa_S21 TaxID=2932478 RepID=UPI0020114E91|nr:hypothetical protein [Lysinibacillus sp. BPa_S21]MCL1696383.1 hypothetical protein [Lysinibacillus sp. BPa_S21]
MDDFYYNLPKLKARVKELEEREEKLDKIKSKLSIGTIIYDLDAHKEAKATRLKNGSNDFEASYLDGSYSRGYHYLVPNWRFTN